MESRIISAIRPWAVFLISSVSFAISIVLWITTNFATKEYVNDKHQQAIAHADQNYKSNREFLERFEKTLNSIDQRTWEMMQRERKR